MEDKKKVIVNTQFANQGNSTINNIKSTLKMLWVKLNRLKSKLGFDTLSDEFNQFTKIQDNFIRNKSNASLDDSVLGEIESNIESLLGRLEIFDSLEPGEVKQLKKAEQPFMFLGQKIELKNYKNIGRITIFVVGGFVGYKYIIKPIVWPALKTVLNTKIKTGKSNIGNVRQADYQVL